MRMIQLFFVCLFLTLNWVNAEIYTADAKKILIDEIPKIIDRINPLTKENIKTNFSRELAKLVKEGALPQEDSDKLAAELAKLPDKTYVKSELQKTLTNIFQKTLTDIDTRSPKCQGQNQSCMRIGCCEGFICLEMPEIASPKTIKQYHPFKIFEEQLSENSQKIIAKLREACESKKANKKALKNCHNNLYLQILLMVQKEIKTATPLADLYKDCQEKDKSCEEDQDCCSNFCQKEKEEDKTGICGSAGRCVPSLDIGDYCLPQLSHCTTGSCQPTNINSTNLPICRENKSECTEDSQCCSQKCMDKKCQNVYQCVKCAKKGQTLEKGQTCCEGYYEYEGKCISDFPVFPPISLNEKKKPWFEQIALNILALFFSEAHAAGNVEARIESCIQKKFQAYADKKNPSIYYPFVKQTCTQQVHLEDVNEILDSFPEEYKSDIQTARDKCLKMSYKNKITCLKMVKEKAAQIKADYDSDQAQSEALAQLSEELQAAVNNLDAIAASYENMEGVVLSAENLDYESIKKNCQFDMRVADYAAMTDEQKKGELAMLAFEFVALGPSVDDCWNDTNTCVSSGDNLSIHHRAKDIAEQYRENRIKRYEGLDKVEKDLKCACLDLKTKAEFSGAWATPEIKTFYKEECPNGGRLDDSSYTDPSALGEDAAGVRYAEMYRAMLIARRDLMIEFFTKNTAPTAELQLLYNAVENYEYDHVNYEMITEVHVEKKTWAAMVLGAILAAIILVVCCAIPVLAPFAALYVVPLIVGAVITNALEGNVPAGYCTETSKPWKLGSMTIGKIITHTCTRPKFLASTVCGKVLPDSVCIKGIYKLNDSATQEAGITQYLLDPMIPSGSSLPASTNFLTNLNSDEQLLSEAHKTEIINLAKTFATEELYIAEDSIDAFAQYVYTYHFIGNSLTPVPEYPSPGLIPYYAMMHHMASTLSYQQTSSINHINHMITTLNGLIIDMHKQYNTPDRFSTDAIAEEASVVKEMLAEFSTSMSAGMLYSPSSGLTAKIAALSNPASSARLSGLQETLSKMAAGNKKQKERYQDYMNKVGNTTKGKQMIEARNNAFNKFLPDVNFKYNRASARSSNRFQQSSAAVETPSSTPNANSPISNGSTLVAAPQESGAKSIFDDDFEIDFNFDGANKIDQTLVRQDIEQAMKKMEQNSQEDGLHQRDGITIFKIITNRYFISGYPNLLSKKRTLD